MGFFWRRKFREITEMLSELESLSRSGIADRLMFLEDLDRVSEKYVRSSAKKQTTDHFLCILKACNLVHLRYEYKKKFVYLASRPTNYLLDTTNNCQLGCGNCIHTFDKAYAADTFLPILPGLMKERTHDLILKHVAPWAYGADYYNMSEPLLNKYTPAFIREANRRRVVTRISSNFAIPSLDTEALIASGLNYLDVAIDGATQETYERYRRGGQLGQVLENVRALVKARDALSSPVPYIRWKFLLFDHNVHETDEATRIARHLGVDEIAFSPAFPGPGGQTAKGYNPDLAETSWSKKFHERSGMSFTTGNDDLKESMEEIAQAPAAHRLREAIGADRKRIGEVIEGSNYCDWLYYCPAFDANGRVRSCAYPDYRHQRSLYYGDIAADGPAFFNSEWLCYQQT